MSQGEETVVGTVQQVPQQLLQSQGAGRKRASSNIGDQIQAIWVVSACRHGAGFALLVPCRFNLLPC
jgi:hypothetical protein